LYSFGGIPQTPYSFAVHLKLNMKDKILKIFIQLKKELGNSIKVIKRKKVTVASEARKVDPVNYEIGKSL